MTKAKTISFERLLVYFIAVCLSISALVMGQITARAQDMAPDMLSAPMTHTAGNSAMTASEPAYTAANTGAAQETQVNFGENGDITIILPVMTGMSSVYDRPVIATVNERQLKIEDVLYTLSGEQVKAGQIILSVYESNEGQIVFYEPEKDLFMTKNGLIDAGGKRIA